MAGLVTDVGFAARAPVGYAVSDQHGSVRVFEVPSGRTLYYRDLKWLRETRAALSADGRRLAFTVLELGRATTRRIAVVDPRGGGVIADFPSPIEWEGIGLSPDGDVLMAANYAYGLSAWSVRDKTLLFSVERPLGGPSSIHFLPGGKEAVLFVTLSCRPGTSWSACLEGAARVRDCGEAVANSPSHVRRSLRQAVEVVRSHA
jgi:hypothetical protein